MTHDELRRAAARLRQFLARYGPYLGRKEVQILAETYVKGLLSDTRKRNAEAIAWEVGDGRVRALQRLLVSGRWDEEGAVAVARVPLLRDSDVPGGALRCLDVHPLSPFPRSSSSRLPPDASRFPCLTPPARPN